MTSKVEWATERQTSAERHQLIPFAGDGRLANTLSVCVANHWFPININLIKIHLISDNSFITILDFVSNGPKRPWRGPNERRKAIYTTVSSLSARRASSYARSWICSACNQTTCQCHLTAFQPSFTLRVVTSGTLELQFTKDISVGARHSTLIGF